MQSHQVLPDGIKFSCLSTCVSISSMEITNRRLKESQITVSYREITNRRGMRQFGYDRSAVAIWGQSGRAERQREPETSCSPNTAVCPSIAPLGSGSLCANGTAGWFTLLCTVMLAWLREGQRGTVLASQMCAI